MADWGLAVHHDADFVAVLAGAISAALPDSTVESVGNIEDAKLRLLQKGLGACRVIVSGLRVPRSSSSNVPALDGEDRTALDLVRWIRQANAKTLPVLLVAAVNNSNNDIGDLKYVEVVCVKDIVERSAELIRAIMGTGQKRRESHNVDLDIKLQRNRYWWHLRRSTPFEQSDGALDIRGGDMDRLVGYSSVDFNALPDAKFLSTLGKDLHGVVMNADAQGATLRYRLEQLCQKTGIPGARIRFIVDQHSYPILLESLTEPSHGGDKDFWMLRTPLFRSVQGSTKRPPLFTDGESRSRPLRCLLIQGQVDPFYCARLDRSLPAIAQAAEEISELEHYLKTEGASLNIDTGGLKVLRHGAMPAGTKFGTAVRDALAGADFDLVHYAGHSVGAGTPPQGYVVFGGEAEDVVEAEEFTRWVARSRFVFLSSCESAGADFVLQMVERTVPAIVGFRWPIGDSPAKFFARNFYEFLFKDDEVDRHLEYAFFKAKCALHEKYPVGRPVWAAPVLVMQEEPSTRP